MEYKPKVCNIDWFELYCLEPIGHPCDIAHFESLGWSCRDRGYGTKHMAQCFVVQDKYGDDMIEVRRAPRNAGKPGCFYPSNGCTLRFVNRYCYVSGAVAIMSEFCNLHHFQIVRISRIDLCLDFAEFDSGIPIAQFVRRIVKHRYAKIYQSRRAVYGEDLFDHSDDNSISWGKDTSMVKTRLYNKTLELSQASHKKPWIPQQWLEAGIIDNPVYISKDGAKVDVWRLEFQIQSSARGWMIIDAENGEKLMVEHAIDLYADKEGVWRAIANLIPHYFRFVVLERGKRKYDCKEVETFDLSSEPLRFKLTNTAQIREYDSASDSDLKTICRLLAKATDADEISSLKNLRYIYEDRALRPYRYQGESDKILQLRLALHPNEPSVKKLREYEQEIF